MSGRQLTDPQISAALRAHLPERATAGLLGRVSDAVEASAQQRPVPSVVAPLFDADPIARRRGLLLVAALLLGLALATATAVGAFRPTSTEPAEIPTAPLIWSPDAIDDPYPAPFREEPPGAGPTVARPVPGEATQVAWIDPVGDGQPSGDSRVDIVNVEYRTGCMLSETLCVFFGPSELLDRSLPDPQEEWIAYGMVMDTDLDGQPDRRFGIDNGPAGAIRAWTTNLKSGTTQVVVGGNGRSYDGYYGESELPFASDTTVPGRGYMWLRWALTADPPERSGRFYLWAALIRDGRIVSVDFAPDAGWLERS